MVAASEPQRAMLLAVANCRHRGAEPVGGSAPRRRPRRAIAYNLFGQHVSPAVVDSSRPRPTAERDVPSA
jgi:hypothetical protein